MSTRPAKVRPPIQRGDGRRHLSDYLGVVRDHKLAVLLVFVLVAGVFTYRAMIAAPVYEASALIQIDRTAADENPWTAWQAPYNLEAETGVLTSHRVAKAAARRAGLHAMALQRCAYRPFELVLKRFGCEHTRCRLQVDADPLPSTEAARHYLLQFDESGERLKVLDATGENTLLVVRRMEGGTPVTLDGHDVTVRILSGEPKAKLFDLTLRSVESAGRWIQENTEAGPIKPYTPLVKVTFSGPTPHIAQDGAEGVAWAYVKEKEQRQRERLDGRLRFLTKQLGRVRKALEASETKLDAYIIDEGAVLLSERASAILEDQGRLREQRLEQEQILAEARRALQELTQAESYERALTLLETNTVDAKTTALATQLAGFEVERGALMRGARRTSEDPRIRVLEAQILETRDQLTRRVASLREGALERLTAKVGTLETRIAQIDEQDAHWDKELDDLPKEERRIAQLARDVQANSLALEKIVTWKQEAEMASQSVSARAHIADDPLLPTARTSPNLTRQLTIGVLLGLFLSLFLAFFLTYLDRSIRSPRELEEGLGVPLFAAIPDFSSMRRRERIGGKSELPARDAPNSALAETYRTLRANLRFASVDGPIQALTVTSASPQEGKTVTTLNLAVAMAQGGQTVVVVDADMRRPNTHRVMNAPTAPGLSEILGDDVDWRSTLHDTGVERLVLIPAGKQVAHPGALLDSQQFTALLAELRESYDQVLLDVPPVLAVSDAAPVYRRLDAVLILARYRRDTLEVVESARDKIERLGGEVVGSVFNAFDSRRAARGSYGYYGYYGRHYDSYTGPRPEPKGRRGPSSAKEEEGRKASGQG